MRNPVHREIFLYRLFMFGMWVKGIDGVLETVGGVLLLFVSPTRLDQLVIGLTQHELVEDPRDVIATALRHATAQLSANTALFASLYLIAHGVVKVVLVVGVLHGKRWAYPAAIGLLCLFIVYQLYRLTYAASVGVFLLTLFDLVIVGLTWHEYRLRP
jgi:uncharacterized membrane protein